MPVYSVHTLADNVLQSFDYETGVASFWSISGFFQNNIGQLNVKLNTSFYIQDGLINPTGEFGTEESAIYKQIYIRQFYTKKTREVLRGTESLTDFITLREGDSQISRVNKNELAKTYRGLASDAQEELDKMVASYNIFAAEPLQVRNLDTVFSTGICNC